MRSATLTIGETELQASEAEGGPIDAVEVGPFEIAEASPELRAALERIGLAEIAPGVWARPDGPRPIYIMSEATAERIAEREREREREIMEGTGEGGPVGILASAAVIQRHYAPIVARPHAFGPRARPSGNPYPFAPRERPAPEKLPCGTNRHERRANAAMQRRAWEKAEKARRANAKADAERKACAARVTGRIVGMVHRAERRRAENAADLAAAREAMQEPGAVAWEDVKAAVCRPVSFAPCVAGCPICEVPGRPISATVTE